MTYKTLRRCGYTGPIVLVIDNTDSQRAEYEKKYPGEVHVFDKEAAWAITDTMDNFKNMRLVVYARNVSWDIAKARGFTHFLMLDDDYGQMSHTFGLQNKYLVNPKDFKCLDTAFESMFRFLDAGGFHSVAWAQAGDFMGGKEGGRACGVEMLRKLMNTFFLSVDRPFKFSGALNEDVSAYVSLGSVGMKFATYTGGRIQQLMTQCNEGGLSKTYLELGTYIKTFYSVMAAPSCVSVSMLTGQRHSRIHHRVDWTAAVPQIVDEKWKAH